jgi:hypothetical protein
MSIFAFINNTSVQHKFYGFGFMTFAKNQDLVNINIQYTRLQDDLSYSAGGAYTFPNTIFIFLKIFLEYQKKITIHQEC